MKILVTGAAGFIGSHTAERLQEMGHNVVGVDNFSPYYDVRLKERNAEVLLQKGVDILRLDLREADTYNALPANIDVIFHFAAQPGISATSTFEAYFSNNFLATQQLIEYAMAMKDSPYFVNIATSSIYGLEATFPESAAPKPASWYGVTKLAAEQLVLSRVREHKLMGTSLRLYSVFGPRERPDKLYPRLIESGLKDKPFPLYNGSEQHLRSFTYIEDIVDGIVSILDHQDIANGEIFNLGTEEENSTATGIATVEEILTTTIVTKSTPPRAGDQSRTKANIDKARKLLGYNPSISLREGLERHIAWFREHSS
ncbi:NAD-dependent epimerase/dehydratase family protein [Flavobacteriaceae bacterium TK19130]|nr:NAD-dependent epimerase/dehydratase family protein [Thermobacterium salinum]